MWKYTTWTLLATIFAPSQNMWKFVDHLFLHFFVRSVVQCGRVWVIKYRKPSVKVTYFASVMELTGCTLFLPLLLPIKEKDDAFQFRFDPHTSLLFSNSLRCDFISSFFVPFSYLLYSPSSIFNHALGLDRPSRKCTNSGLWWKSYLLQARLWMMMCCIPRVEVSCVGGCVNGLDRFWGWCDGARMDGRATSVPMPLVRRAVVTSGLRLRWWCVDDWHSSRPTRPCNIWYQMIRRRGLFERNHLRLRYSVFRQPIGQTTEEARMWSLVCRWLRWFGRQILMDVRCDKVISGHPHTSIGRWDQGAGQVAVELLDCDVIWPLLADLMVWGFKTRKLKVGTSIALRR